MLSDRDISKYLNKEIVIFPFNEDDLTPVGYNLNPSDFVFSLKSKDLVPEVNGAYSIQPHDTVLILTQEAVWVSKKIAGTFHSKVGVVSAGFGHISTTLDPDWKGPLLISLNNPTDSSLELPSDKSFVTLVFYKVRTPALKDHDNLPNRTDIIKKISDEILLNDLTENQKTFLKKANAIFNNENIYKEFTKKYNELTDSSHHSILEGLKKNIILNRANTIKLKGLQLFEIILGLVLLLRVINFIVPLPVLSFLNVIDKGTFIALLLALYTSAQSVKTLKEEVK